MDLRQELQGFDIGMKSAAVIGCGALGCNVCAHLAGAGIGCLFLYDGDVVHERNLNRQFFYTPEDEGKPKVQVLRSRLKQYNPDIYIKCFECMVDEDSSFKGADVVILCADNGRARKTAGRICGREGLPLVNGGVDGLYGSAYLYVPGKSPDLEAAGLCAETGENTRASSAAGVIGALEAELAVRVLSGDEALAGTLMVYDGMKIEHLKIKEEA